MDFHRPLLKITNSHRRLIQSSRTLLAALALEGRRRLLAGALAPGRLALRFRVDDLEKHGERALQNTI